MRGLGAVLVPLSGVCLFIGLVGNAPATVIDLTVDGMPPGTVNGALFGLSHGRGGTGYLNPFVRLQADGSEQGYNTSNGSVPFDEKTGSWTHDLRLNEIPVVPQGGSPYLEFLLDINENTGNGNEFLSLDALRVYTSPSGSQNTADLALLGTLRYDLDAGGDSVILLNYNNAPGSGQIDMTAYMPVSVFAGVDPTEFVYLYSQFGLRPAEGSGSDTKDWSTSDGFEEWAVETPPGSIFIPEPASLGLLALVGLAVIRGRRR